LAIVNSEKEAELLHFLYATYGPASEEQGSRASKISEVEFPLPKIPPTPGTIDADVHIGFHDIFIEGEYLSVLSK
jgi:hypothetical protein